MHLTHEVLFSTNGRDFAAPVTVTSSALMMLYAGLLTRARCVTDDEEQLPYALPSTHWRWELRVAADEQACVAGVVTGLAGAIAVWERVEVHICLEMCFKGRQVLRG
ncbi:hypothetical protein E2C01_064985 [Portunus trituberculatus]|uniref:Uncharacterized protein n=1 Tax=Portunus trituberculatus TaxID=210409 RepID=A0A5B7HDA3_PORTR|nr:hypothetical protein [Portunus trituberculatus]